MTITIGNSQGIPMGKYTPSTGGGTVSADELEALLDEKQDILVLTDPLVNEVEKPAAYTESGAEVTNFTAPIAEDVLLKYPQGTEWFTKDQDMEVSGEFIRNSNDVNSNPFAITIYKDGMCVIFHRVHISDKNMLGLSVAAYAPEDSVSVSAGDKIAFTYRLIGSSGQTSLSFRINDASEETTFGPYALGGSFETPSRSDESALRMDPGGVSQSLQNYVVKIDGATVFSYSDIKVLKLKLDGQTITTNADGELTANMDELGNEVNAISGRVTTLETNMGGLKLQKITQADYDALTAAGTVDENTMYLIVDDTTT